MVEIQSGLSQLILRKPQNPMFAGRSSDSLRFSVLPIPQAGQWIEGAETQLELTAAVTVADLHDIPF